ncbi:VOC family protein [bacterium]|nr:VOC family protein [bacterium]
MQKITPHLWFDSQAEEAANFYVSIFKGSTIGRISRYGEAGAKISGKKQGTAMTVAFELAGQPFMALNGGPVFRFNEAISFMVTCETQQEIDYYWEKLSESGDETAQQCGWLKDKFGVSWQIVPAALGELMSGDPRRSERVMEALLRMKKLDLELLRRASEGEAE